jgi:tRNA(fMet)-specific endonuclease VapC
MKRYLVDTNIWIHFFKGKYGVRDKILNVKAEQLCVSEISIAELIYGAYHSSNRPKHLHEANMLRDYFCLYSITECIDDYARLRDKLTRQGRTVENFDLLIAATAIHYQLILVTENVKHFKDIPGLEIENWANRET